MISSLMKNVKLVSGFSSTVVSNIVPNLSKIPPRFSRPGFYENSGYVLLNFLALNTDATKYNTLALSNGFLLK